MIQGFWGEVATAASRTMQTAAPSLGSRVPGIIAAVVIMLVAWLIGRLTHNAVRGVLARASTTGHVDTLIARFARAAVVAAGIVMALGVIGLNVTGLVASLGLVGLTLGLALKDVLANYIAGVMLLMQGPFRVGDTIKVAGMEGKVLDVTTRDTTLSGPDGRRIHIPNSTVFGAIVENVTADRARRFEITFTLPAEADLGSARGIILGAMCDTGGILSDPAPDAQVTQVGHRFARIVAHAWVDTVEHAVGDVQGAAHVTANHRLREAGLLRGSER